MLAWATRVNGESAESQEGCCTRPVGEGWESRNGPDFHPTVWLCAHPAHPCETAIKNRIELLTSHHVATLSPKPDMTWKTGPLSLRCVHMKTRRSSLWWETKQFQNTTLRYLEKPIAAMYFMLSQSLSFCCAWLCRTWRRLPKEQHDLAWIIFRLQGEWRVNDRGSMTSLWWYHTTCYPLWSQGSFNWMLLHAFLCILVYIYIHIYIHILI